MAATEREVCRPCYGRNTQRAANPCSACEGLGYLERDAADNRARAEAFVPFKHRSRR